MKAAIFLGPALAVLCLLAACGSNSGTTTTKQQGGFTNSSLQGTYTFFVQGEDKPPDTPNSYEAAGVFVADGNGNITKGEETYSDGNVTEVGSLTGTYTIASSGLGTISLNTGNSPLGFQGTQTFSVVLLSSSHAFLSEFEAVATSTGTLDQQTSTAMPTGGYAFAFYGGYGRAQAIGGVFNIDNNPSTGNISGNGSMSDFASPTNLWVGYPLSGSVTAPDALGKVAIQFSVGYTNSPLAFDGYIVDATHLQMVENDSFGANGGTAIGQGASTGTFSTDAAFSGNYVFGSYGTNSGGIGSDAGVIAADGTGGLANGLIDQTQGKTVISDSLSGTYTVDAGTGRVTTATAFGTNGAGPTLIFYLTGGNNPIPVLQTDQKARSAGFAYLQSSSPVTFSGTYAAGITETANFLESDTTAAFSVSGGSFSGTANENAEYSPTSNQSFSGTVATSTTGRYTGTITTNGTTAEVVFYFVDSTHAIMTQTDGSLITLGSVLQATVPQ